MLLGEVFLQIRPAVSELRRRAAEQSGGPLQDGDIRPQIEALDMGRRGLHNEGSELLRERLAGKIEVDHDTARRLFTLICALHIKS